MSDVKPFPESDQEPEPEVDQYGNPVDGSRFLYCCAPDCGCPDGRLCAAEKGYRSRPYGP